MKQGRCLKQEYNKWLQNYELELRSVMKNHENLVIQGILTSISKTDKFSQNTVYKLITWRKCQSLSQGNMHSSMVARVKLEPGKRRANLNLQLLQQIKSNDIISKKFILFDECYNEISKAFEHQNFVAFKRVTREKHDKFSFDIIAMLLYNKFNYQHLRLFLKQLINFDVNTPNNFKILRYYGRLVIKNHFEKNFVKLLIKKCKLKIIDKIKQTSSSVEKNKYTIDINGIRTSKIQNNWKKNNITKKRKRKNKKQRDTKSKETSIMTQSQSQRRNQTKYNTFTWCFVGCVCLCGFFLCCVFLFFVFCLFFQGCKW